MAGGVAVASGEIRHGDRVFSGNSGPAQREQPINKELIAHFKSKGDSVSWGIAASIENYEEDTKRPVLSGACIASLYDQETERELAEEVENRIERVLSDDAALLKIRRYLKTFHADEREWDVRTCAAAARGGNLECLKYLHEHGCAWDKSACEAAALRGHSECLKYLHTHGCPGNKRASEAAAGGDVMECLSLKYLHRSLKRKIYR